MVQGPCAHLGLHERPYLDKLNGLYMSKKDIAIISEWGNGRCTHFMILAYFTPDK
jgi:hypothetical protein